MDISEAADKYLYYAEFVRNFSKNTIKPRRVYLRYFIEWLCSNNVTTIECVTNDLIDNYHAEFKRCKNRRGHENKVGTVNESIKITRAFLKWCATRLKVELSVVLEDVIFLKDIAERKKQLTFSEIYHVVQVCEVEQDRLMIALDFEAGLRIEELRDARYEDFRGTTLDVIGKGRKHRITYVSFELKSEIDGWMKKNGWSSGPLFRPLRMGVDGEGYKSIDSMRDRIENAFTKYAGIQMNPHMLRHAFALNLLENGCSLRSIQLLLGHSNIETTMKYLQVTDKFLEKSYREHFGGSVFNPLNIITQCA